MSSVKSLSPPFPPTTNTTIYPPNSQFTHAARSLCLSSWQTFLLSHCQSICLSVCLCLPVGSLFLRLQLVEFSSSLVLTECRLTGSSSDQSVPMIAQSPPPPSAHCYCKKRREGGGGGRWGYARGSVGQGGQHGTRLAASEGAKLLSRQSSAWHARVTLYN